MPGERVTLQSYPDNKYIGGEPFENTDSKCDMSMHRNIRADDYFDQMKSNEMITIITKEQIRLDSGQTASRFEIDSLGRSVVVITEINGSTVVLTCYGDFSLVDPIAITLKAGQ